MESAYFATLQPTGRVSVDTPIALLVRSSDSLAFLPGFAGHKKDGHHRFVDYADLDPSFSADSLRWPGPPPHGVTVEEWTWQFVDQDGSPDPRFKDNERVPILSMRRLALREPNEISMDLLTGDLDSMSLFHDALVDHIREAGLRAEDRRKDGSSRISAALSTLGLGDIPPPSELNDRYRLLRGRTEGSDDPSFDKDNALDGLHAAYEAISRRISQAKRDNEIARGVAPLPESPTALSGASSPFSTRCPSFSPSC